MGIPLLVFMIRRIGPDSVRMFGLRRDDTSHVDDFMSRPGMLFLGSWLLLCSRHRLSGRELASPELPLEPKSGRSGTRIPHHNRGPVCPCSRCCPWSWPFAPGSAQKSGIANKTGLGVVIVVGLGAAATFFALGYTRPAASLLAGVSGTMIVVSVTLLFVQGRCDPSAQLGRVWRTPRHGLHGHRRGLFRSV